MPPRRFRTRVERFLEDYLGSPQRPQPFGGRDQEIGALNDWLGDGRAGSRLLLTAPAGRGKSALLVHWATQVPAAWRKVFVPISIRRDTASASVFYQLLACNLAQLFIEEPSPAAPGEDLAQFYKDVAAEYLDRLTDTSSAPTLVVIDGIDEAAGWHFDATLVPANLPPQVKVVISAREQLGDRSGEEWLRRLAWERPGSGVKAMTVGKLLGPQLRSLLAAVSETLHPVSASIDVVQELERLTEGEPVLIRYYVEDMLGMGPGAAGLTAEELAELQPGFAAYFRSFIEQHLDQAAAEGGDEALCDCILAVLTAAPSPIRHADLAVLVGMALGDARPITARSLAPLRRFILGDGMANGYVLQHARLATYLRGEYFKGGGVLERVERAALSWCARVTAALASGEMAARDTPEFVRRNYSALLKSSGRPAEEFLPLVSESWRQAWTETEEGNEGFAGDVHACWDAQIASDPPEPGGPVLAVTMRCALVVCSMNSLEFRVPPPVLPSMVDAGLVSGARALRSLDITGRVINFADRNADFWQACQALLASLPLDDRSEKCAAIFRKLATPQPESSTMIALFRCEAISALATVIPDAFVPEAFAMAESLETERARLRAVAALMPRLPEALRPRAIEIARNSEFPALRAETLVVVARCLQPSERAALEAEAIAIARKIASPDRRAEALAAIAPLLPREAIEAEMERLLEVKGGTRKLLVGLGRLLPYLTAERQRAVTAKIYRETAQRSLNVYRTEILNAVVGFLPEEGIEEAFRLALGDAPSWTEARALAGMVPKLPQELREELLEVAMAAGPENAETPLLVALVPYFTGEKKKRMVRAALEPILERNLSWEQHTWLVELLPHLSDDEGRDVLRRVLRQSMQLNDVPAVVKALVALADLQAETEARRTFARAKSFDVATGLFGSIEALFTLAARLTGRERQAAIDEVLQSGEFISIREWLIVLTPAELRKTVPDWLCLPDSERDHDLCARALDDLSPHLTPDELALARRTCRAIQNVTVRAWALGAIAAHDRDEPSVSVTADRSIMFQLLWKPFAKRHRKDGPATGLFAEALAAARQVPTENARSMAFIKLAPKLRVQCAEQFCDALLELKSLKSRAETIAVTLPHLPVACRLRQRTRKTGTIV